MPHDTQAQPLPFADEPIEVSESEDSEQADDGEVIIIESLPDLLGKGQTWYVIGRSRVDAADYGFLGKILRIAKVFRFPRRP